MEASVDLMFHYMGKWVFSPHLRYAGGETNLLENFDVDFLSYTHIRKKYINHFGYSSETKIYVLKPGKKLDDGLLLIEDDEGIKTLTKYLIKSKKKLLMHIYAHDVDDLPYFNIIELLNDDDDIEAQCSQIGTQCSYAEPPKQVENEKSVVSHSNVSGWVGNLFAEGLTPPHLSQLLNEDTSKFQESWGRNITDNLYDGIVTEHVSIDMNVENDTEDVIGQKIVSIEGGKISVDILEDGANIYDSALHLTDVICDDSNKNYEGSDEEINDEDQNCEEDELETDTSMSAKSLETDNSHFMLGMTFSHANEARDATCKCHIEGHNQATCKTPTSEIQSEPVRSLQSKSFQIIEDAARISTSKGKEKLIGSVRSVSTPTMVTTPISTSKDKGKVSSCVSAKSLGGLCNRRPRGGQIDFGIYFDEDNGNIIENPGMQNERFVSQVDHMANQPVCTNSDPEVRFPIPNEREIRQSKLCSKTPNSTGSRKIGYVGDGYNVQFSANLPFKAPGLKWHGEPCTTSRQLQELRQQVINKVSLPQKDKK